MRYRTCLAEPANKGIGCIFWSEEYQVFCSGGESVLIQHNISQQKRHQQFNSLFACS